MRISKAWIVAAKDIRVFLRKRYTIYSLVVFPIIIVLSFLILLLVGKFVLEVHPFYPETVYSLSTFFIGGRAILALVHHPKHIVTTLLLFMNDVPHQPTHCLSKVSDYS